MSRSKRNRRRNKRIFLGIGIFLVAASLCAGITISSGLWIGNAIFGGRDTTESIPSWSADSAQLTIAVSPLMAPVLSDLANRFNSLDYRTPDGNKMTVWTQVVASDNMIQEAMGLPPFQAIVPDSSLWLDQLELAWTERLADDTASEIPIGNLRIGDQVRFAVSPVVIVAWQDVARELGWPNQPIGWQDIQQKATDDADFKWNHAATNTASGLLATLAEFYAGAELTRGLTAAAATDEETIAYVQAVESTIRFYGEGEDVIVQRLASEGRNFLDAFVAQEQVVIQWNMQNGRDDLVAIYPSEGTLWTDHPLALLELGVQPHELAVTNNQRLTFSTFADFLLNRESQEQILAAGYRPADLEIALDAPSSPFFQTNAVDWRQPQTTLQIPPPAVIDVVRNVWYYTKRPTNVYLVVDTSGSMEGTKIARTREALAAFVGQIQGDRDRLGIIEFGSGTKSFTPLRVLNDENRRDTLHTIDRMEAFGGTALIDAVHSGLTDLSQQADMQAINALVVMTDGQENESYYQMPDLRSLMDSFGDQPIVIFTIGFGRDADERLLREMAEIGQGQFRSADETDIEELYRILSTYF